MNVDVPGAGLRQNDLARAAIILLASAVLILVKSYQFGYAPTSCEQFSISQAQTSPHIWSRAMDLDAP